MTKKDNSAENGRLQVLQAAGIVSVALLIGKFIGLIRASVIANYLGATTLQSTAFETANRLPEFIFIVFAGGAIGSAFIPTFLEYFAKEDEKGAWRLFSAICNLIFILLTILATITALFAPQIIGLLKPELVAQNPEFLPLTVRLLRIMLTSSVIFGVSGVIMGTLNARQHFLLPALAPIIYNLGIIAGGLLFDPPILGFAYGTVIGALGHLLIQLPGLRWKNAQYSPVLSLKDAGVRQVLRLMTPRVIGLSFSEINKLAVLPITDALLIGNQDAALNRAFQVMLMPQSMVGQALGIAAFPTFSALAAEGKKDEMRTIVADALRLILFIGIPASIGLMLLAKPIIRILFERGQFTPADTELAAWALLFYAVGLVALTSLEVINRSFYALKDTWTPVIAGVIQTFAMIGLSLLFGFVVFPALGWLPLGGIALAFSLSNFVESGVLLWLLQKKMAGINGRYILAGAQKMLLAGLFMGAVIWAIGRLLTLLQLSGLIASLLPLILLGIIGVISYGVASHLLNIRELNFITGFIKRRLNR